MLQGWLGFSVDIRYFDKDTRTDGWGKRILYVSAVKEISATTTPATFKNYLLSTQEAA